MEWTGILRPYPHSFCLPPGFTYRGGAALSTGLFYIPNYNIYQDDLPSVVWHTVWQQFPNLLCQKGLGVVTSVASTDIVGGVVTNRAQPLRMDIPHFCAWTFPTCMDLFETVIECTATDHVIFSRCIYTSFHGNLLALA